MKITASIFLLFFCIGSACLAQTAAPITPEQILAFRGLSDVQISPDGERVAFTDTDPPKGAARNTDIWMFNTRTRDLRRLTTAPKKDSVPRWSPDGQTIAFLSNRDGKMQIYLLAMDGGEAAQLTESKSSIKSFA